MNKKARQYLNKQLDYLISELYCTATDSALSIRNWSSVSVKFGPYTTINPRAFTPPFRGTITQWQARRKELFPGTSNRKN